MLTHQSTQSIASNVKTFFINSNHGPLFAIYYPPAVDQMDHGDVIYVHPFGEELNASRHIIAAQARRLNTCGYGVLIMDLYGCGDSAGDSRDASWKIWKAGLEEAFLWLKKNGRQEIILWGLRLGALLAMDFANSYAFNYKALILWQPSIKGADTIRRLLRLDMLNSDTKQKNIDNHLKVLERTNTTHYLEIGKYLLASEFISTLKTLDITPFGIKFPYPIHWVNIGGSVQESSMPKSFEKITSTWKNSGANVKVYNVPGKIFWANYSSNLDIYRFLFDTMTRLCSK